MRFLRDPRVDATRDRARSRKREDGREPAEPADAAKELGHGVGAGERASFGQHELHRRHARLVGDLGVAEPPRRRPAREDLERAAGERQAHEPERARPAHRALSVVDQDRGRVPHPLSER